MGDPQDEPTGPTLVIEGEGLVDLLIQIDQMRAADDLPPEVYRLSFDKRRDGFAFKVNERMWTRTWRNPA